MKKLIYVIFLIPLFSISQKIAENKIDDFTKNKIIRTSWEHLATSSNFYSYVRISKIDSSLYLNIKFDQSSAFGMKENAEIMIKLENDSVLSFRNPESKISCTGCGAIGLLRSSVQGMELDLNLSFDQISIFKIHKIQKIRIYILDGYIENEVKEKNSTVLIRELNLF